MRITGKSPRCHRICADPGSPAFGLPGAIALARWQTDNWQVYAYEALCSLDAVRFRLPLVLAVACMLTSRVPEHCKVMAYSAHHYKQMPDEMTVSNTRIGREEKYTDSVSHAACNQPQKTR